MIPLEVRKLSRGVESMSPLQMRKMVDHNSPPLEVRNQFSKWWCVLL